MDLHWSQRFSLKFFVGKERASREADSEKRVCNHPGEQFLKICGFGELIHWVRVDRRLIRVKNIGFKKIPRFVWTRPMWTLFRTLLCPTEART